MSENLENVAAFASCGTADPVPACGSADPKAAPACGTACGSVDPAAAPACGSVDPAAAPCLRLRRSQGRAGLWHRLRRCGRSVSNR